MTTYRKLIEFLEATPSKETKDPKPTGNTFRVDCDSCGPIVTMGSGANGREGAAAVFLFNSRGALEEWKIV